MFKFKKIASVLASAVMLSSTIGFAAAASYPAPFVVGGTADGAVVYGANAAISDVTAAIDVQQKLGTLVSSGTSTGSGSSITGEAAPLFTSSSPLFLNATLDNVKSSLTSSDLDTVLADGTFDGVSSVKYTQRLYLGKNQIDFAQMPSDSDDPQVGIALGTNAQSNYLYNATVSFDSTVNFSHADSIGEDLMFFGQRFTVGAATTNTKLVLFKSAEKLYLASDTNPSQDVTVEGSVFTIELTAASDTAATIKVTDSSGKSAESEINEASSKKINGLEVSVDNADENNFRLTASVSVGSSRITLQNGVAVKMGTDEDIIDGTHVNFYQTNDSSTGNTGLIGKISFLTAAKDSQSDAVTAGNAFVDPIFGTFKVDFAGLSIPISDTTNREMITVKSSGNDKMNVIFQSHDGTSATTYNWVNNNSAAMLLADSDRDFLIPNEMALVNQSGYVVLANDKEGGVYEVTQISNSSSTTASDDSVTVRNVFTGDSQTYKATAEGTVTINQQGKSYTVNYYGASTSSNSKDMQLRVNYPESAGQAMIAFPTVMTDKGAKVAFYQPVTITNMSLWDGTNALTGIDFPDGDGYTSATGIVRAGTAASALGEWNFTMAGAVSVLNTTIGGGTNISMTVGQLNYNITSTGTKDGAKIFLANPDGGALITQPALIIFEERDDKSNYEAVVVVLNQGDGASSTDIGVSDIVRTWSADRDLGQEIQLETNDDLYQDMDFWGSLFTLDKSNTNSYIADISYPDDQVVAEVYIAEEAASITPGVGGGGAGGQVMIVKDSEVVSVSGKNLVVVGGSCINTVAAKILGSDSPLCAADFTTKTGTGVGQYLIKSIVSPYNDKKVALLVAGYEASDTMNAVKKAMEGVMTDAGTTQVYPIASA